MRRDYLLRAAVAVVSVFVLTVSPYAHADTSAFGINDPFVDALQLWTTVLTSIDSIAHELASALQLHQASTAKPHAPNNPQQPTALAAAAALATAFPSESATTSASHPETTITSPQQPASNAPEEATSDQTTQSPFVKSAEFSPNPGKFSTVSPTPATNFVTQDQFNAAMSALGKSVQQLLAQSNPNPFPEYVGGDGNNADPYGAANNISQLNNVTITNPTITGLTAGEIPNLSGSYLSLGGGTLSGAFIDSGSASSSFAGALGIGATSPSDVLAVNGPIFLGSVSPAATADRLYNSGGSLYWAGSLVGGGSVGNWTTDGTNVWRAGGNVGIGTTSPAAALDINGNVHWSGQAYYDNTGAFTNRNAAFNVVRSTTTPSGITPTLWVQSIGLGNNSTFEGVSNGYFQAADNGSVTSGTKGVLYGLQLSVRPLISRNNVPYDDATGLVVQNDTPNVSKATDAVYVGHNSAFTGTTPEWITSFLTDANTDVAYRASGNYGYGFDLCFTGGCAGISSAAIRIPNNTTIVSRNAAGNGDVSLAKLDTSNVAQFANGKFTVDTSSGTATTSGSIEPSSDGTLSLGKIGDRFNTLYAKSFSTDDGSQNWGFTSPNNNADFAFYRSGVEMLRITQAGNLGIGTSSPRARLDVAGANNGTTPLFQLSSVASFATTTQFIVNNNGNVGIGTTSPGSLLSLNNIANFSTATSTFYSTGGVNLAAGCFAISGNCISLGTICSFISPAPLHTLFFRPSRIVTPSLIAF